MQQQDPHHADKVLLHNDGTHLVGAKFLALGTGRLDDQPPAYTGAQACAAGDCKGYVILAWLLGIDAARKQHWNQPLAP